MAEITFIEILSFTFYFSGKTGLYYCAMKVLSCSCCDGHCGPNNGCNCPPCQKLDKEEEENLKEEAKRPKFSSSQIIDSWTWGPQPGMLLIMFKIQGL